MDSVKMPNTNKKLNKFLAEHWEKTLAFLQGQFKLPRMDCEDIFQDATIILYKNIIEGKLQKLNSSLSTYFLGICKNKAYEKLREKGKDVTIFDEYPDTTQDEFEDEKINSLLTLDDDFGLDDAELLEMRKEALVREIVAQLPPPCDKILWGFYRDGLSMKTLASMYNYKNENSLKVTKHRCGEKFKARFLELSKRLFN